MESSMDTSSIGYMVEVFPADTGGSPRHGTIESVESDGWFVVRMWDDGSLLRLQRLEKMALH